MELRDFAERILFGTTLEEKLAAPGLVTDENPGPARPAPAAPGRPPSLRFKPAGPAGGRAEFPGARELEHETERGRLLHFFANHELLATELMALVLLKFPEAPAAFRRGVLQTLRDEQQHTRLYLQRMSQCGVTFGELPVSGYFWRSLAGMETPLDYVAGLSLTFEQANLDYCREFAETLSAVGDHESSTLLEGIYRDEIGHVAYGLKWFRRWKHPRQSDWDAYCRQLKFPLSPNRAKGVILNVAGRRAAGLDAEFIDELNVYSHSKGRTPSVFVFNPFTEAIIARGAGFSPVKEQAQLAQDLSNLPQFLCRQDDVVLVPNRPSVRFLSTVKEAGFSLPQFVVLEGGGIPEASDLRGRKLAQLRPWAWGPDSARLLEPLRANASSRGPNTGAAFSERLSALYSKTWSAALLRQILAEMPARPWLCAEQDAGVAANTLQEALSATARIRQRGHHRVVVKQAHGLAGRNMIRLWEPEILATQRRWIERAVEGGQAVVVEPWLERVQDFSLQLEMTPSGLEPCGYTGLLNDPRGQFVANWAGPGHPRRFPIEFPSAAETSLPQPQAVHELYEHIIRRLETGLRDAGYLGPVGIDAFVYRGPDGRHRLKPIVEINPRYTMGRLTLELMKHACPGSRVWFRLLNRPMARAAGFGTLADLARSFAERSPIRLAGSPVPRIREGMMALNDPETAKICLAVLEVSRPAGKSEVAARLFSGNFRAFTSTTTTGTRAPD